MTLYGCDFLYRPSGVSYSDLFSWGIRFIGRYTGTLSGQEVVEIYDAGLGLGPIYFERDPNQAIQGYQVGRSDAANALAWAQAMGITQPIVLACDREVHDASQVSPYYQGCDDVGGGRLVAYGDTDLLDGLGALGLPAAAGVGCSAWSYNKRSRFEQIHQFYDDYPPDAPNLEAHGLHYGATYDLLQLVAPSTLLVSWPTKGPSTPASKPPTVPSLPPPVQEALVTGKYVLVLPADTKGHWLVWLSDAGPCRCWLPGPPQEQALLLTEGVKSNNGRPFEVPTLNGIPAVAPLPPGFTH